MKKKLTAVALIVCMLAIMLVGASLAYFTDEAEATNTMVVGNVEIKIEEKMYDGTAWVDYTDEQVLYPIAQSKAPFNKAVFTYNTSPSEDDVYIRTIIALPHELYDYVGLGFNTGDYANGRHGVVTESERYKGTFEIDGKEYDIWDCTEKNGAAVKHGDYVMSLCRVWLYDHVTQEQIKALNLTEAMFEIKVLSQGIQTYNLTHAEAMEALGAVTQDNIDIWFAADAE